MRHGAVGEAPCNMADVVSDGDSLRDVEFSAGPGLIDAAAKILPNRSLFRSRHRPDPTHRTTYSATPGDDATVRPVAAS